MGSSVYKIRHSRPDLNSSDLEAVQRVLLAGDVSGGTDLGLLEEKFSELTGKSHALAFNSWTSAAYSFFRLLASSRPNSTVIVPSFSFAATANVVINAGLKVAFADVHLEDGSLKFESVAALFGPEISAVMTVHYAGIFGRDTIRIKDLCDKSGVVFVEDAAEALGAFSGDGAKMAGSLGVGIFSFFATKNITSGEGGVITFENEIESQAASLLRGHGVVRDMEHPWQRNALVAGHNFRLSNMNAALALSQVKRIEELNAMRRKVASQYSKSLRRFPWIQVLGGSSSAQNSWQMFPVLVQDFRNEIVYGLLEHGIEASVHFDPPIHAQKAYRSLSGFDASLESTTYLSDHVITLPMHPGLLQEEVELIVETLGIVRSKVLERKST